MNLLRVHLQRIGNPPVAPAVLPQRVPKPKRLAAEPLRRLRLPRTAEDPPADGHAIDRSAAPGGYGVIATFRTPSRWCENRS